MKIVILNGSPRKGNTAAAINAFVEGVGSNHEVEIIDTNKVNVSPCRGCGACECCKGCVAKDDSNEVVDKIAAADLIVFASPVYWWGVTAQLKLVIDKCYCKAALLKGKKTGLIITGGSPVDHPQFRIITEQFECMAEFLSQELLFVKSFFVTEKGDFEKDVIAVEEMRQLGATI